MDELAASDGFLLETCMYYPFVTAKSIAAFGEPHGRLLAHMDRLQMILSLALALGYASPARMLREMRPHELGEWIAYAHVSPWGERRADLRAAIVASVIVNE